MKKRKTVALLVATLSIFMLEKTGFTNIYNSSTDVYGDDIKQKTVMVNSKDEIILASKNAENSIITLTQDIELSETLTFSAWGSNNTIDLNGNTLKILSSGNAINIDGWGAVLTIDDTKGGGVLHAEVTTNAEDNAAIKVSNKEQTVVIKGGEIFAKAGIGGAGIGGHLEETGNIIIENGVVNSIGGENAAGIGGGYEKHSGNILITGGIVNSTGGENAAGIGTGGKDENSSKKYEAKSQSYNDSIIISNGKITATGGENGAGIGGGNGQFAENISILNGIVEAAGGTGGAGIGSGSLASINDFEKSNFSENNLRDLITGMIEIYGGQITSTGGQYASGIGTGEGLKDYSTEKLIDSRMINIYDGNIIANGGVYAAGIGGGSYLTGGNINIGFESGNNLELIAKGGENAAGIGGGMSGLTGEELSIYAGNITAIGGNYGAGIGSGGFSQTHLEPIEAEMQALKNINLLGGNIKAVGGIEGASIGGGSRSSGSNVKIGEGSVIVATGTHEYSIGAGSYGASHGTLEINGGNVNTLNKMGSVPVDSDGNELYKTELTVFYNDGESPIKGAKIKAISTNDTNYNSIADEFGKVSAYYPKDAMQVVASYNSATIFKDFEIKDGENKESFSLIGYEPLILADNEIDYYINSYPNEITVYDNKPMQIDVFKITDSASPLIIDETSGKITIPREVNADTYQVTIESYSDNNLVQRDLVTVNVKNQLEDLIVESTQITTEVNDLVKIMVSTKPEKVELSNITAKISRGTIDSYDGEIQNSIDINNLLFQNKTDGLNEFTFMPDKAGDYALILNANDGIGNEVTKVVNISAEIPKEYEEAVNVNNSLDTSYMIFTSDNTNETPTILAWEGLRNNEISATIRLVTNKDSTYYYKLINDNNKDGEMTKGYFLPQGNNEIPLKDLTNTDYKCYIKMVDNENRESKEIIVEIPKFDTQSIISQNAEDVEINNIVVQNEEIVSKAENLNYAKIDSGWGIREDMQVAKIGFSSNVAGSYYYGFVFENGPMPYVDTFRNGDNIVAGLNEITIDSLPDGRSFDIYVYVKEALTGKVSEYLKIEIPPFIEENKEANIYIEDATRVTKDTVVVDFHSDISGSYSYIVKQMPSENIFLDESYSNLKKGENQLILNDLSPYSSYEITINQGETTSKIADIPIYENSIILTTDYSHRTSLNKGYIDFISNKSGIFKVAIKNDNGNLVYIDEYYMSAGVNTFNVDNLFTSKDYVFHIIAEDARGNISNEIVAEIGEYL